MKISCDVDCTPEEARRFLGLPDLAPVHEAYIGRMTKAMTDAPGPEAVTDMMKAWGPMTEAGTQMWQTMLGQMAGQKIGSSPKT